MICASCRLAGALNKTALESQLDSDLRLSGLELAAVKHGQCDGRCDCQHFIGAVINQQLVRQR